MQVLLVSLNIRNTGAKLAIEEASMGYGVGAINLVASERDASPYRDEAGRFDQCLFFNVFTKA